MADHPLLDVTGPGPTRYRSVRPATLANGKVVLIGKKRSHWPGGTEPTTDERAVVVATAPGPFEVVGRRAWTLGDGWTATAAGGCGCGAGFLQTVARQMEGT